MEASSCVLVQLEGRCHRIERHCGRHFGKIFLCIVYDGAHFKQKMPPMELVHVMRVNGMQIK